MHIPDGFLTVQVWAPACVASMGSLSFCLKRVSETLKDKMVPLMGVMSAFIFAAQMLNFPVIGGTSGHLLGGVLAAILLGPYAGAIVLTCVLMVQCLIFQDGGITALGANILNMAIIGTMGGYFVYRMLVKVFHQGKKEILMATAIASWLSVVMASLACACELAFSGTASLKVVLLAMGGIHALIGCGEALITTFVIQFILKVRPDLIFGYEKGVSR